MLRLNCMQAADRQGSCAGRVAIKGRAAYPIKDRTLCSERDPLQSHGSDPEPQASLLSAASQATAILTGKPPVIQRLSTCYLDAHQCLLLTNESLFPETMSSKACHPASAGFCSLSLCLI